MIYMKKFLISNLLSRTGVGQLRTSNLPSEPIFRHNATAMVLENILANTPTFRTELSLFSPGTHASSLIYYPFDE